MDLILRGLILIVLVGTIFVYFQTGNSNLFKVCIFILLAVSLSYQLRTRRKENNNGR